MVSINFAFLSATLRACSRSVLSESSVWVRPRYKTYNDRYSLHTPGVIAAPRDVAGPVMPGVRRTPGRPRARDTQGRNDLPPCAGHRV